MTEFSFLFPGLLGGALVNDGVWRCRAGQDSRHRSQSQQSYPSPRVPPSNDALRLVYLRRVRKGIEGFGAPNCEGLTLLFPHQLGAGRPEGGPHGGPVLQWALMETNRTTFEDPSCHPGQIGTALNQGRAAVECRSEVSASLFSVTSPSPRGLYPLTPSPLPALGFFLALHTLPGILRVWSLLLLFVFVRTRWFPERKASSMRAETLFYFLLHPYYVPGT